MASERTTREGDVSAVQRELRRGEDDALHLRVEEGPPGATRPDTPAPFAAPCLGVFPSLPHRRVPGSRCNHPDNIYPSNTYPTRGILNAKPQVFLVS